MRKIKTDREINKELGKVPFWAELAADGYWFDPETQSYTNRPKPQLDLFEVKGNQDDHN